jgi:hypothetical protein
MEICHYYSSFYLISNSNLMENFTLFLGALPSPNYLKVRISIPILKF